MRLIFIGIKELEYVFFSTFAKGCNSLKSNNFVKTSTVTHFRIRRGFDIRLEGEAERQLADVASPETYALKPTDFPNIERPKLLVAEGDTVQAGTSLLYDKQQPAIQYTSPVSGEVVKITRGEKRRLLEIVILSDKEIEYESFPSYDLQKISTLDREKVCELLCGCGVWPHILQRPYGTVASPESRPRDIFVSCFDTHPLAPDYTFSLAQDEESFSAGLAALRRLTDGNIYLSLPKHAYPPYFAKQENVQYTTFEGPHPTGNLGVQIHHIRPINKGEIVWTTTPFGVVQIGRALLKGRYDTSIRIALTGPEVVQPQYYQTHLGASIKYMVKGNLRSQNVRFISGNVLTGERIPSNGHLGFYHQQISVLSEGNYYEAFGWALPSLKKLSFHRGLGLLSFLFPKKKYQLDTNTHGEERAFAQTGVFEQVLPMDILPTYLIKAILAEDYDEMETLGIYEVVEEDVALCEFVDLSKHELQKILRRGLNLMQNS